MDELQHLFLKLFVPFEERGRLNPKILFGLISYSLIATTEVASSASETRNGSWFSVSTWSSNLVFTSPSCMAMSNDFICLSTVLREGSAPPELADKIS